MMKTCSLDYNCRYEKPRSTWMQRHPLLSGACMLVAVPAGVVLAVGLFTVAIMYPVSSVMGWL